MSDLNNDLVRVGNARSDAQRKVMEQIVADGVCPFCRENLDRYHKNPILKETKYWLFTDNQWPYKGVKHQVLAIYKTHIEHIKDMPEEAGGELLKIFGEISKERNMPGGGVAIRFGKSPLGNYGSSVNHLHAHLIEPDLEHLEDGTFKFKFGESNDRKK